MISRGEPAPRKNKINILFLTAEAEPLIKVGGLGDVSGSLPRALNQLPIKDIGFKLDIILSLPFHPGIDRTNLDLSNTIPFQIVTKDGHIPGQAYCIQNGGLPTMLVSGPPIPDSGPVYSSDPKVDGEKFTFAALGALEAVKRLGWKPDIIHANDWHTAMAVYAVALRREWEEFYRHIKTIINIHNLPFIGVGTGQAMEEYCLPPLTDAGLPWWAEQLPLPLGLATADRIVAVSPGYRNEMLSAVNNNGLDEFIKSRKEVIIGILNGIDNARWNPETDQHIPSRYDSQSLEHRQQNKAAVQEYLALPIQNGVPLLVFIGRMDPQKGIDLVVEGLRRSSDLSWQTVILGTGDEQLEYQVKQLEMDFPDRVRSALRFDDLLARQLYSGADILLIPSRYEPCGLAQMFAMRYGCVPVARRTGGLKDTIIPYPDEKGATGFLFDEATAAGLSDALRHAVSIYHNHAEWKKIQVSGMQKDYSWHNSARGYARLYHQLAEEA